MISQHAKLKLAPCCEIGRTGCAVQTLDASFLAFQVVMHIDPIFRESCEATSVCRVDPHNAAIGNDFVLRRLCDPNLKTIIGDSPNTINSAPHNFSAAGRIYANRDFVIGAQAIATIGDDICVNSVETLIVQDVYPLSPRHVRLDGEIICAQHDRMRLNHMPRKLGGVECIQLRRYVDQLKIFFPANLQHDLQNSAIYDPVVRNEIPHDREHHIGETTRSPITERIRIGVG